MKPRIIAGIVIVVAVVAGVGGYLFLKPGVPSVSAPAGFTMIGQTTEGGNTITTYSGTGTTQEAYSAFRTWMGGQGWQYRIDNGALGGYRGHLYEKGNEVAVVQATSPQAGKVTVIVASGPKPSEQPDDQQPSGQLTSDFTPPTGKTTGPVTGYGPWNMRLMSATSTDGLNFTRTNKVITDQGDVPDLVQDNRGWIYLYYVGWTVGTEHNKTVVAISQDGGGTWIYKKVNLSGFGAGWASPVDPDVQILPDGIFRIYLTSDPHDEQGPRTYYAEGTDGINFTMKGVAFSRPGKQVLDPSTLLIGPTWHYFAGAPTEGPGVNWHATSTDGTSFTLVGTKTFEKDGVKQMFANGIAVPGGYRGYTFTSGLEHIQAINSFFTSDGVTWTADPGTRLTVDTTTGKESWGVKDPAVVRLSDGAYLMVYVTAIP